MKERIPECPAYFKCREKTDCGICLALPVEEWKEHVRKVLKLVLRNINFALFDIAFGVCLKHCPF